MTDWRNYLAGFHARSPGITEDVLKRATADGLNAYDWLARAVAPDVELALDLGCGSAPMAEVLSVAVPGRRTGVIGMDISEAELRRAARSSGSAGCLVRGAALRLPFADASFDAVIASMALMVFPSYTPALEECARVLRPGGVLAATVPTAVPMRTSDVRLLTRLTAKLRALPQYPGGSELTGLRDALATNGFRVLEDARERFSFPVRSRADADLYVRSLYLPGTPDSRRESAAAWLAERAEETTEGLDLAVPIRRVVAARPSDG